MNVKLLGGALIATTITAIGLAFAPAIEHNVFAATRGSGSYSCNDIVFSNTVGNTSASTDISDLSAKGVTSLNCSMTNWTNANYASTMTDSAIKIGGSKTGKYSGSVKLTLKDEMTTSRLIVYAAGWAGDADTQSLGINGEYQDVIKTAKGTSDYTFEAYTFNLNSNTNEIIISNDPAASGSRRIVISKIVLRLHNESSGEGSGGDTPVDPTPVDPPTPSTEEVTATVNIGEYASAHNWVNGTQYLTMAVDNNITATVAGGGNSGKYYTSGNQWRIYQTESGTLTIAASSGYTIKTITVTYTSYNGGVFNEVASATELDVNSDNITLNVANSGSATNGQARVTAISVTYQANN